MPALRVSSLYDSGWCVYVYVGISGFQYISTYYAHPEGCHHCMTVGGVCARVCKYLWVTFYQYLLCPV